MQKLLEQFIPDYADRAWTETVRFKRIMLTESPAEQALKDGGQAALDT